MRLLLVLMLAVTLVGCDMFGTPSEQEYLDRAESYYSNGKSREAVIALKNVLSKNPDNGHARWMLGQIYADLGEVVGAEIELEKARDLAFDTDRVLPVLGRALLAQGKFDPLLALQPAQLSTPAARADLLSSHGFAYLRKGDAAAAEQAFEAALSDLPGLPYALVGRAGVAAARGDTAGAYRQLDAALAENPDDGFAWSYRGDLKRFEGQLEEAIDAYGKAIAKRSANWSDRLQRALLNARLGRIDEADKDVQILKQRWANAPDVLYAEGLIHLRRKQYEEAQVALELALKGDPRSYRAAYLLGSIHLRNGNLGQAAAYANATLANDEDFLPASKLLAAVRSQEGRFTEAEEIARHVLQTEPDDLNALNLLASSLTNQGKLKDAIEVYDTIASLDPNSYDARMRLGLGRFKIGDFEGGEEALASAINLAPERSEADAALALSLLQANLMDKAVQAAEGFVARHPKESMAYNMLGLARVGVEETAKAQQAFEQARALAPGDPTACSNLARHALAGGDLAKAQTYYREILSKYPKHLSSLLNAASIEARLGNTEQVIPLLERAVETNPDIVRPKVLLAREYIATQKAGQALNLFGGMLETHGSDPVVLTVMGEIYLALGQPGDALAVLRRAIDISPDNVQAHFLLARAYVGAGDATGLEHALRETLRLAPRHSPSRIALTKLLILQRKYPEAKAELARLRELVEKDNPDVLAMEGAILASEGEAAGAIGSYEEIFQLKRDTASLVSLSRAQWMLDAQERSLEVLQDWVERYPADQAARLELADRYLRMGRETDAVEQYKKTLAVNGDNIVVLNNLAWFYRNSDVKRALSYAEKAYAKAPGSAQVVDTLAATLIELGQLERAERILERAERDLPGSQTLRFRKAVLLEKRGRLAEARATLETLLAANTGFAERNEAQRLLERLGRN